MNINRIYKAYNTLNEMLVDRGYESMMDSVDIQEFTIMLKNNNINIFGKSVSEKTKYDNIYVYFNVSNTKFDKKGLLKVLSVIEDDYSDLETSLGIILVVNDITAPVVKDIDSEEYSNIQLFHYDDLQKNISKNKLVPRHILLTSEEIKKIANEEYDTSVEDFCLTAPTLQITDPIAKYYGLKKGDVCKIIRRSMVNGITVYYRVVK